MSSLPAIVLGVLVLLSVAYAIYKSCGYSNPCIDKLSNEVGQETRRRVEANFDASKEIQGEDDEAQPEAKEELVLFRREPFRWLKKNAGGVDVKVKILVSLLQMLGSLGLTFSIQYPPGYRDLLNKLSNIISIDLPKAMPLGCMIEIDYLTSLAAKTALPLAIMLFLVVGKGWASKKGQGSWPSCCSLAEKGQGSWASKKWQMAADMCDSGWFYVLFLVYPSCTSATFQAFLCDNLPDGTPMLRVDYSITCWEGKHMVIVVYAVVMGLLYPIGTPLLYAKLMHDEREEIHTIEYNEMEAAAEEVKWRIELKRLDRKKKEVALKKRPEREGASDEAEKLETAESDTAELEGSVKKYKDEIAEIAELKSSLEKYATQYCDKKDAAREDRKTMSSAVKKLTTGYSMHCCLSQSRINPPACLILTAFSTA